MKEINPEHIKDLLELINQSDYFQLLDMKVCELGPGYSKVMMELDKKHLNPFGGIHGGAYASVIDTAAYWAAYCDMEEDAGYTSMDLCVNNLATLKGGCILAEGRRIKSGRNIYLCEAEVKDGNGKLIAHGTSKLMVLAGRQSIRQALEAVKGRPLPAKFLESDNL